MSPLEFLEYHLLSGYFFLIYPLNLLASARHILGQSDSHISLQFGVRYLLVYFQHCLLFLRVGSLWILCLLFLKSNTSFLTSLICCLVIEKFPLIRFDMFFSCWVNPSLNTFLIKPIIVIFVCHLVLTS